ncbi:ATP-binding cassette domain-containing protein, partial [Streptomyces tendae]
MADVAQAHAVGVGAGEVLAAGRITVIVGANACGKSTLLRSMSRLLAP